MIDIKKILAENVDQTYRQFNKNIVPGAVDMIGVRMPVLRRLARQVALGGESKEFLASRSVSYEEVMLRGLVTGYVRSGSWDDFMNSVRDFVPQINNWAVCDCFCSTITRSSENLDQMLVFIDECLASGCQYTVRFAVVMLMDYYLVDSYVDVAIERLVAVDCSGYYVMMGVAWAVSVAFVRYPQKTKPLLVACVLDEKTHRKSIQKILESYRVSVEDKAFVRSLRVARCTL